ncbi:MAG: dTMP kinase [Pseudomonadota bacterium]|nr:dTMP kinase [Pseudomonadota bacterium]
MTQGRGIFITVEGGEGCGKSTLIRGLAEVLSQQGRTVKTTREPGGTPLAESVRQLVLSPPAEEAWSPLAEALLMNAARSDHVDRKIRPWLEQGSWVLCDRFSDSTLVYQGVGGVSSSILKVMQAEVTADAHPDITLILDAEPEALLQRREARSTTDVFERKPLDFHKAVRREFLNIAQEDPDRCVILDALQSPEAMVQSAMQAIQSRFSLA